MIKTEVHGGHGIGVERISHWFYEDHINYDDVFLACKNFSHSTDILLSISS